MKKKRKSKYYLVLSERKRYTHGAFPFTEQGLSDAKKYVKRSEAKSEEKLIIEERP